MKKKIPQRIVGIDYGLARIGLALSDESQTIATPLETVKAEKKTEDTVLKVLLALQNIEKLKECAIEEIIVGLPLMMSGKTGFLADEVKHFVAMLASQTNKPVHTWDERLTTVQAERSLRESDLTRKRRAKVVDVVSAAIILQSYLDYKKIL